MAYVTHGKYITPVHHSITIKNGKMLECLAKVNYAMLLQAYALCSYHYNIKLVGDIYFTPL